MTESETLRKEFDQLKHDFEVLNEQMMDAEAQYTNTIVNTAVMIKTLDDLGKIAGNFNKKTQAMNVVYMCCEALRCKHPDAVDGVGNAFWDAKQIGGIRDLMLDSFKTIRNNE